LAAKKYASKEEKRAVDAERARLKRRSLGIKPKVLYTEEQREAARKANVLKYRLKNKDVCRRRIRDSWAKNPAKRMWTRIKSKAAKHGIPFNLDVADIDIPERCPVLGIALILTENHAASNSPSLDRLIPSLG
jgi:hypothetical protein